MSALLVAEGLAEFEGLPADLLRRVPTLSRYIEQAEGSEAAALAACVEHQAAQQAAEAARQQRQQRMEQLLQQEGVPAGLITACYPVARYIQHSIGSEESALLAARQSHATAQRREAVVAALAAEGLPDNYTSRCSELSRFINGGEQALAGGLEAAMAAARLQHERETAQVRRGGGRVGGS